MARQCVPFDPTKHLLGIAPANAAPYWQQLVVEIWPHQQLGYFKYSLLVHGRTEIYCKRGVRNDYAADVLNVALKKEGFPFTVDSIEWSKCRGKGPKVLLGDSIE